MSIHCLSILFHTSFTSLENSALVLIDPVLGFEKAIMIGCSCKHANAIAIRPEVKEPHEGNGRQSIATIIAIGIITINSYTVAEQFNIMT